VPRVTAAEAAAATAGAIDYLSSSFNTLSKAHTSSYFCPYLVSCNILPVRNSAETTVFLSARRYDSAVVAVGLCLCVCVSVTSRFCIETATCTELTLGTRLIL